MRESRANRATSGDAIRSTRAKEESRKAFAACITLVLIAGCASTTPKEVANAPNYILLSSPNQVRDIDFASSLEPRGFNVRGVMTTAGFRPTGQIQGNGDFCTAGNEWLGLSDLIDKAVAQETDVREVLSQVALGQADAGFVYATDARTVKGNVGVIGIPKSAQPRVRYAAAAVKSSKHLQAAKTWIQRLLTSRAQRKLRAAGFLPVPR